MIGTTAVDKGVGYCLVRSGHHRRRLGHLFVSRETIDGVDTVRCCWCWCKQT